MQDHFAERMESDKMQTSLKKEILIQDVLDWWIDFNPPCDPEPSFPNIRDQERVSGVSGKLRNHIFYTLVHF